MPQACVLRKALDLGVEATEEPNSPQANEVVVRMKSVGICGSDVSYWQKGAIGDFVLKAPMIMGHESAGEVVSVGPGVKHLVAGDRVALEPGVPCRACPHCRTGSYNLCPDIKFFATPPVHGSLQTFVTHAADFAYKLPQEVSYEEGAMCEPLSVGVYACERARLSVGDHVLILGAGPIGLICMLVAKALGAARVVMTDVSPERLAFAQRLGADAVFDVRSATTETVSSGFPKAGQCDVAIECCGMASATSTAIRLAVSGGTVVCVGLKEFDMQLPMFDCFVREVDLRGVFRYRNTYPRCIELIRSGRVDVKPLITHRFNPWKESELLEAFEVARTGRDGAMKVMFDLGQQA